MFAEPRLPVKACHACRRSFTLKEWDALPRSLPATYISTHRCVSCGTPMELVSGRVEARTCPCGTSMELDRVAAGADVPFDGVIPPPSM